MASNNTRSKAAQTESTNAAAKQQVSNTNANTTRRVVETRDQWERIFAHAVTLVVAYTRGQKPADPRKGFAFAAVATQPHSRAYAKSLIWGLTTNKAGKALKGFDDLAEREAREKIAIAILADAKLVKGDSEAIKASLAKVETKREKTFALAVLSALQQPTEAPAPADAPKADEPKPTTPKGGKAKGGKKSTTKGGKGTKTTTKGAKK